MGALSLRPISSRSRRSVASRRACRLHANDFADARIELIDTCRLCEELPDAIFAPLVNVKYSTIDISNIEYA